MTSFNTNQGAHKNKRLALYGLLALLCFAVLLAMTAVVVRWLIEAEEWVKLVRDVDHRMQATDFADINSDRIRSPREASDIRPGDFNIIVLGDSFIHGFILQYKLAMPKQLEERLRTTYHRDDINVWNFGWTTSSPVLQLRLLQDIGKKYQPDLVLVSVDMTDYKDDYFYRHLIAGEGIYGWIKRYPRTMYLLKSLLAQVDGFTGWHRQLFGYPAGKNYFVASEPMETNRQLFDETYDSLNRMHIFCRDELRAPLVVFIPPRHWQYTDKESPRSWEKGSYDVMGPYALENYRYFDLVRSSTPYPLVPLLDAFRNSPVFPTTFEVDSHWNKHGAGLMADAVLDYLQQQGFLSALGPAAMPPDNHR